MVTLGNCDDPYNDLGVDEVSDNRDGKVELFRKLHGVLCEG